MTIPSFVASALSTCCLRALARCPPPRRRDDQGAAACRATALRAVHGLRGARFFPLSRSQEQRAREQRCAAARCTEPVRFEAQRGTTPSRGLRVSREEAGVLVDCGQDPNCDSFGNTPVRVPAEPPGCSCLPPTGPPCARLPTASRLPPVSLGPPASRKPLIQRASP